MKLAIVGGGSTYTPELIDGFARLRDVLPLDEVHLVDPDAHRLGLVAGMARRMLARAGHPATVVATNDLVAGVSDADAVLVQLRVGGQATRNDDETWPHDEHCIGQETTGPGGFAKALRTVPVMLSIADVVRRHARPDAWIIDFTNPVGIVTRALLQDEARQETINQARLLIDKAPAVANWGRLTDDTLAGLTARVDGQTLRIGAAVTHAQIEDGVHEVLRGSMLQYVAGGIAYRAVRNRGTVGGSLAHADPAADWVLALTALAATLELQSTTGTRKLGMDDFMLGAYTTALQAGEIITAVQVPLLDGRARWGYQKFCRKTGEFAEASCAAVFDPTRQRARVVLGALDGAPRALPELARQIAATGRLPEPAQIDQALAPLGSDPVRLSMQRAVVTRCLRQVLGLPGGASSQEKQP